MSQLCTCPAQASLAGGWPPRTPKKGMVHATKEMRTTYAERYSRRAGSVVRLMPRLAKPCSIMSSTCRAARAHGVGKE